MVSDICNNMITVFHMAVITNSSDWWFDFGAMLHVCNYKAYFKTYEESSIELKVLVDIHIIEKFHGSELLKWNWVLARSFLDQCFSCTWYQEKPICYLRMVLPKNGIIVGNGYAINDIIYIINLYKHDDLHWMVY